MESSLVKTYYVPADVRKQTCKFDKIELYSDKVVAYGNNTSQAFFFKHYIGVEWVAASLASQFASVVFLTPENATRGAYMGGRIIETMIDANKILFCSGMYSYFKANNYALNLLNDIKPVFEKYHSEASQPTTIINQTSSADELKKFKDLLDSGIITQEEFDAKKKQLLGL